MDLILPIVSVTAIVLVLAVVMDELRKKKYRDESDNKSEIVKCWIVVANTILYDGSRADGSMAQVIYTLEKDATDWPVEQICEQLRNFTAAPDASDNEKALEKVMSTHKAYDGSLSVPSRLTDGLRVFSVSVYVRRDLLPEKLLTRPYIYCKIGVESNREPVWGAVMVPYPKT